MSSGDKTARRRYLFFLVGLGGMVASQAVELFINRVLRPDVEEITWLSELVLASGFVIVAWLWLRLQLALDLPDQPACGPQSVDARHEVKAAEPGDAQ